MTRTWTQLRESTGATFRMMCLNVLADSLVDPSHTPNCPQRALRWQCRQQLLLEHIQAQQVGLLCLQEVDSHHFEPSFMRPLRKSGYAGKFKKRTGEKNDGCCTMWREDRFELLHTEEVEMMVPKSKILDRDNIALIVVLRWRGELREEVGGKERRKKEDGKKEGRKKEGGKKEGGSKRGGKHVHKEGTGAGEAGTQTAV